MKIAAVPNSMLENRRHCIATNQALLPPIVVLMYPSGNRHLSLLRALLWCSAEAIDLMQNSKKTTGCRRRRCGRMPRLSAAVICIIITVMRLLIIAVITVPEAWRIKYRAGLTFCACLVCRCVMLVPFALDWYERRPADVKRWKWYAPMIRWSSSLHEICSSSVRGYLRRGLQPPRPGNFRPRKRTDLLPASRS